ncbi:MAG: hypothetical protein ACREOZ_03945 [Gloeomargaritales cyanobacterium]
MTPSDWVNDEQWRAMSRSAQIQMIADRLARAEGQDTRSLATAAQQHSVVPMSVLSIPHDAQTTAPTSGTASGSVITNMMNSQYANPNRTINALKTIRLRKGATCPR